MLVKPMKTISIFSLLLFCTGLLGLYIPVNNSQSAEVDSWTKRKRSLERDPNKSLKIINKFTNKGLLQAVTEANSINKNKQSLHCDEKVIFDKVYNILGGFMYGKVENFILEDKKLEKERTCVPFAESAYRDFSVVQGTGLNLTKAALGCTVNIKGKVVGSDKFGHFFGQGYTMATKFLLKKQSLAQVLEYGDFTEKSYFGLQANGVYSYGDLAANYEGFKFWMRLTGSYQKDGAEPYVKCVNGNWKINASFDWDEYISPAWDEGNNCNYYRGKDMHAKVEKRINELGYTCPISEKSCGEIIRLYGHDPDLAKNLISPACALSSKNLPPSTNRDFYTAKEVDLDEASDKARGIMTIGATIGDLSSLLYGYVAGPRVPSCPQVDSSLKLF